MTDIRQEFTLDPSQAVAAIKLLDSSFDRFATRLENVGGTMNSVSGDSRKLTTSLSLLARITFTQSIVRGMSLIRREVGQSLSSVLDFEKVVSQAIAISPGQKFDTLADAFRKFSNQTGVALQEVAVSGRELASSGFNKLEEQLTIMNAAWKLQAIGVSDFASANELLIGTLNALGKGADFAETFSAKFFRTVDIGNITVEQLAHNFGRIAPLVRATGASVEEALALFSSLTIKGINPNEASTQISALFNAFIKPSKEMQAALEKLGTTGSQLIKTKGIVGAMKAVVATTDGTSESFGKLFVNVRGLRGLLSATSDQFKTLTAHLNELRDVSAAEFNTKAQEHFQRRAQQIEIAHNRITNAIRQGIGNAIADVTESTLNWLGGLDEAERKISNFKLPTPGNVTRGIEALFGIGNDEAAKRSVSDTQAQVTLANARKANIDALQKELKLRQFIVVAAKQVVDVEGNKAASSLILERLQTSIPDLAKETGFGDQINPAVESLDTLIQRFQTVQQQGPLTADSFRQLSSAAEGIKESLDAGIAGDKIGAAIDEFNKSLGLARQAAQLTEGIGKNFERAKIIADASLPDNFAKIEASTGKAAQSAVSIQAAATSAANESERAAKAWKDALLSFKAAQPQGKAFGGFLYRAGGGFSPRGTDTIPAMLSPGEFVVNRKATQQWFSQLVSMNAGRRPIFREQGGPVSNTTVGDITVNVAKAGASAKDIADAINRGLRTNKIRLR